MQIRQIGVIGGGTMGQGIALVVAESGLNVVLQEISQEAIDRTLAGLNDYLDSRVAKWGITAKEKSVILSRIEMTSSFEKFDKVQLVIEAIDEDLDDKHMVFDSLRNIFKDRPDVIFASNTSTLSISKLASFTDRPEKFIGLHFQPPVPKKPLVEIVRGLSTSDDTLSNVKNFAKRLGKETIEVNEWPGYVTTRVIMPLINEAVTCLMEGVASAEDIDKAMELGCGMQMGPLRFADAMGLDTVVFHLEHLFHELGELKYRPCPLLKKMIRAGHLGMKSGQGFFTYSLSEAAKVELSAIV